MRSFPDHHRAKTPHVRLRYLDPRAHRAVLVRGRGTELNPRYFADGVAYVEAAASEASVPTLFDLEAS